jgi:hypothetical protein
MGLCSVFEGLIARCKNTREMGADGWLIEKWHHLSRGSPDEDPTVEIGVSIVSTSGLVSTGYVPFYQRKTCSKKISSKTHL